MRHGLRDNFCQVGHADPAPSMLHHDVAHRVARYTNANDASLSRSREYCMAINTRVFEPQIQKKKKKRASCNNGRAYQRQGDKHMLLVIGVQTHKGRKCSATSLAFVTPPHHVIYVILALDRSFESPRCRRDLLTKPYFWSLAWPLSPFTATALQHHPIPFGQHTFGPKDRRALLHNGLPLQICMLMTPMPGPAK